MARPKRIEYTGALHHVVARGNRKADIFRCDRDRRLFLMRLGEACVEFSWRCLSYCLMSNHYHLVIRTDQPGLSVGMQMLNARYAEHFNLAYGLTGHVFQGRYRSDLIESEPYLFEAVRYVELNPVRAQLCVHASDWDWNSYAAVVGFRTHTAWFDRQAVLGLFAADPDLAVSRFVAFIAEAADTGAPEDTPRMRQRRKRDLAIREAYAAGNSSIRTLAATFGVSVGTVAQALKRSAEGSDPSAEH